MLSVFLESIVRVECKKASTTSVSTLVNTLRAILFFEIIPKIVIIVYCCQVTQPRVLKLTYTLPELLALETHILAKKLTDLSTLNPRGQNIASLIQANEFPSRHTFLFWLEWTGWSPPPS